MTHTMHIKTETKETQVEEIRTELSDNELDLVTGGKRITSHKTRKKCSIASDF